jgi:hypothetical protein
MGIGIRLFTPEHKGRNWMRLRSSGAFLGLLLACAASGTCAQKLPSADNAPTKRLFYIGLALYSEAWSQNDVVELAGELDGMTSYRLVPLIASNVAAKRRDYPIADDAAIGSMVRQAANQARPDDLVFVNISTHGGPKVLASKIGNHAVTDLSSARIARMFAPLAGRPTIMIISACYSGSLIGDLRARGRIIITAARADRSSFGCAPGNRHTLFGQAELRAFGQKNRSLHQVYMAIIADVSRMEHKSHETPSEPRVSVGADMTGLYDAPLF